MKKDYLHGLGMRYDLTDNRLQKSAHLDTVVQNIQNKSFTVIRQYDIEDLIEKMMERG